MDMVALCHERRECESAVRVFGNTGATNNYGRTGEDLSRFEFICHHLCTPDNAYSMRDEASFFAK